MANSPDPLANNPEIKKWAERFYAVKSWSMPDTVHDADTDDALIQRLKKAKAALGLIKVGAELSSGARRAFAGGLKVLAENIRTADKIDDFDTIDTDIAELATNIATQMLVAHARGIAEVALEAEEERVAGVHDSLDGGSFAYLEGLLRTAQSDFRNGVQKADFEAVSVKCTALEGECVKAEVYGVYFDAWAAATLSLVTVETNEPAKTDKNKSRTDCMGKASGFAIKGTFDKAKDELDKWHIGAGVPDTELKDAHAFEDALTKYEKTDKAVCDAALRSIMKQNKKYKDFIVKAKKKAYSEGKYIEGIAIIVELVKWATDRKGLVEELSGFSVSSRKFPAIATAIGIMDTAQVADDIPTALTAITDLNSDAELLQKNECFQYISSWKNEYNLLLEALKNPELQDLKNTYADFKKKVGKGEYEGVDGAILVLPKLNQFKGLMKIVNERAEIIIIGKTNAALDGYLYSKDLTDALAGGNYGAAIPACHEALAKTRKLVAFLELKDEATVLAASLTSPLKDALDQGILDADTKAIAKDPDGAIADLKAVLNTADYLGLSLEMTDYFAKKVQVEKRHKHALKFIKGTPGEGALNTSLLKACQIAEPGGEFGDAYLALDTHDKQITDAQAMGSAKNQIKGIIAALKRKPLAPPKDQELSDIEARVAGADKDAGKADFAKASAAYESVLSDLKGLCKGAAADFEAADHVGCEAGHSVARHGPDVSDEDLILRLSTGTPPNPDPPGIKAYTQSSSKFESPQDWLAGREMAAQAALALPLDRRVDVAQTDMVYDSSDPGGATQQVEFIIDHGRPIDKAFFGQKRVLRAGANGEPEPGKTFETYEEMEGLTRALVNYVWVPDPIDDVPVLDPATNPPGALETFLARDNKAYAKAISWKGEPTPPTIPGRWVMMQQYPHANGWDDDLKIYTNTDPENLIP